MAAFKKLVNFEDNNDSHISKYKLAKLLAYYYHLRNPSHITTKNVNLQVLHFQIYFYPKVKTIISHLYSWNLKKRLLKDIKGSLVSIIQSYFRAFKERSPTLAVIKISQQPIIRSAKRITRRALRVPKQNQQNQNQEDLSPQQPSSSPQPLQSQPSSSSPLPPPKKRLRNHRLLGEDGQLTKMTLQHTELNSKYCSISEIKIQSTLDTNSHSNQKKTSHFSNSGSHPSHHKWTHTNIEVARRDCQNKWKDSLPSPSHSVTTLTWSPTLFFPEEKDVIFDSLILPEILPPPLPSTENLKGILKKNSLNTIRKNENLPEKQILFIKKHKNSHSNSLFSSSAATAATATFH